MQHRHAIITSSGITSSGIAPSGFALWGPALSGAALLATATPAAAQDYVQFGTGVDYSTGDYGDSHDTDMLAVPFTAKVQAGNFHASAQIPYLRVHGPENVVPGDGGATPGNSTAPVSTRKGLGDLILGAGYTFALAETTFLVASGKVKLPTASERKFLGTGTTDFTAQGELLQVFGSVTTSVRGGRRFNGSSAAFPLRDVWQAGAGVYYQTGKLALGLDYDWREKSLPTSSDRSEATLSATYRLNPALRLQGYGYAGFTDSSPDVGGGVQLLYRFGL
ncbi:MAG: transporter [Novosphingobium sp.]